MVEVKVIPTEDAEEREKGFLWSIVVETTHENRYCWTYRTREMAELHAESVRERYFMVPQHNDDAGVIPC